MNKFITCILILSSFSPRAVADQAIQIKAGEPAKFDGILMDQEKSNKVKIGLDERDLFEQIVNSQTKSIQLLKDNNTYSENKVNLLLTQNDSLAERLQASQGLNNWERIGLVVLGIAMTCGAGLAIRSLSK